MPDNEHDDSEVILDISGRKLQRLEKAPSNQSFATALVLDNNKLQNLNNLDSYGELERLSVANNLIVRMYWFARMYSLRILNLPGNNIVQIEGLRELQHLIHLNLAGNKIKVMEGLSYNHKLEHLNLSGNNISHINDLSLLRNLKEVFLHRNNLSTLHRCSKHLPSSLIILTLSDNVLSDLNELCNLSHLCHLEQLTILNNPCLDPLISDDDAVQTVAFDYRPYVINWCLNLKVLDGYRVTPKESLKAEWLYSQGKGRAFQVGEHEALVHYLSGVCLAGGGWGGAELPDDDEKLAKILQLAKQHQQELRHDHRDYTGAQVNHANTARESPPMKKKLVTRVPYKRSLNIRQQLPPTTKSHSAKLHAHSTSKGPIAQSYHVELCDTLYGGGLKTPDVPGLMTQSMDPSILAQLSGQVDGTEASVMTQDQESHENLLMSRSLDSQHLLCSASERPFKNTASKEVLISNLISGGPVSTSDEHLNYARPRPTHLFNHEASEINKSAGNFRLNSHLSGCSTFVPAPESIISPELFAQGRADHAAVAAAQSQSVVKSKLEDASCSAGYGSKSDHLPPSHPQAVAPQPLVSSSSSSSVKQLLPADHRNASHTAKSKIFQASDARRSPKPAPRHSRSQDVSLKSATASHSSQGDSDSDNTDSEVSVSKLKTIKCIAAERKHSERKEWRERKKVASHIQSMQYNPDKYKSHSASLVNDKRKGSDLPIHQSMSDMAAAVILQKHWRGYWTRHRDVRVERIRHNIRHSRAEQHIKFLTEKLNATERALERERRLRHLQLEAIKSLWREIQKLQVNKKDSSNTPSTPMTPLTPLTPMEKGHTGEGGHLVRRYSEESVKELTKFCTSLQDQVMQLQGSLSMVTQVMTAFCNLPVSRSLLSKPVANGSLAHEGDRAGAEALSSTAESVSSLTNSVEALTSSLVSSSFERNKPVGPGVAVQDHFRSADTAKASSAEAPPSTSELDAESSIAQSASVLPNDSAGEGTDAAQEDEGGDLSESSISESLSGSQSVSFSGPGGSSSLKPQGATPRPSSLPVARPHTPRSTS